MQWPGPPEPPETGLGEVSPLIVNRLSVYLGCLRRLQAVGLRRISSKDLASRFRLSATQIRKDLAIFGDFGIRGVGYDVDQLAARLTSVLGLDAPRTIVVVGVGNLGSALARYLGFNTGSFHVVAGVDNSSSVIGRKVGSFLVRPTRDLPEVVAETQAEIGLLTVPAEAAQENYDALVKAGVRGVLNFTPARIKPVPEVPVKDVDLRIHLEELAFLLAR
ncbi:MAG TPA: redox-sensing transcriptional repressor Rex [Thermoanaerobaculia bacterium]|nr:redox-sensing transcriptional repressor Rex [Thermoanaerobaculia bacterium]